MFGNWLVAEPLKWPPIATINFFDGTVQSIKSDGQAIDVFPPGGTKFISKEGATISDVNGEYQVKYKGRLLWRGEIVDFSAADGQISIVAWSKKKAPSELESNLINLKFGTVVLQPNSWTSFFKGGYVVAQQDPVMKKTIVSIVKSGVVTRQVNLNIRSLELIQGLDSDGTNIAISWGKQVTFFGKGSTWSQSPGILHEYRLVKLVDEHSIVAICLSESGLVGSDFHVELLSHHNSKLYENFGPRFLLVGEDAERLISRFK